MDVDGNTITFYPFLVVVERHGRGNAIWLPYWHVVEDGIRRKKKFGQWAPFMDEKLFVDLIVQARENGCIMPAWPYK